MAEIKVKNVPGTSDLEPEDFSTWIEYWEDATGKQASRCHVVNCNVVGREKLVGAHVEKADRFEYKWYIVPICKGHNKSNDEFYVYDALMPVSITLKDLMTVWTAQGKSLDNKEFPALAVKYQKANPGFIQDDEG